MKRFWRTCSKRLAKKYFSYFYQDGVVIKYDSWDARMKPALSVDSEYPDPKYVGHKVLRYP